MAAAEIIARHLGEKGKPTKVHNKAFVAESLGVRFGPSPGRESETHP